MIDILINFLYKLIELLDKRNIQEDKLVWSHLLNGVQIKSESGWSPAAYIHMTKPFTVYKIRTIGGLELECADEHILFDGQMNTVYAKDLKPGGSIMTEYGVDSIESVSILNRTVSMGDVTVLNDNESYYSNHILSHNTTTSAIFMLHYILFNVDKNSLVLGNKRKTAVEILDKVKNIYYELPYYLKPGIYKWNEGEIVLDNGCRCMAEATTVNSGISFTFHCILADEFSKIAKNIQEPFYEHVFPTVIAANARFMISSTVNLDNPKDLFYRLLTAAKNGDNDYAPFEVTWRDVPDWDEENKCWVKRDEKWHRRMIANYGSEEAFEGQFGIGFEYTTSSIIASSVLKKRRPNYVNFIPKDLYGVPCADKYFWKPDYEPMEQLKRDYIVATIDLAEGLGEKHDDTICCFNKVYPGGKTECVGYFRANDIDREVYAMSFVMIFSLYCNMERLLVSFEKNTYGDLFIQHVMNIINSDERLAMKFDIGCFVKYYNESGTKWVYGIKITSGNKTPHCILFKEDYEKGYVDNNSQLFYDQIVDFGTTSGGHYAALNGNHDDIVMAQMQIEFVKETLQWKMMVGEIVEVDNVKTLENTDKSTIYNPFETQWDRMIKDAEENSNYNRLTRIM